MAGEGFEVAAEGGWGESGTGAAVAAGNNAGLASDRETVADGALARAANAVSLRQ
jgi:hypothetical protein